MEAEKPSAVALSVNVGSFSDPKECPGLAHFLEHMLFMGTKSFPGMIAAFLTNMILFHTKIVRFLQLTQQFMLAWQAYPLQTRIFSTSQIPLTLMVIPDEKEWEAFLSANGGGSNASTDAEVTVFQVCSCLCFSSYSSSGRGSRSMNLSGYDDKCASFSV